MIEYDWQALEILNGGEDDERIGVLVLYTPVNARLTAIEKFVPIPWKKATDRAHAEEILARKVEAYAPAAEWAAEETPPAPDKSDAITAEIKGDAMPTGRQREPEPETKEAEE